MDTIGGALNTIRWTSSSWSPWVKFIYTGGRVTKIRYEYASASVADREWNIAYDASDRISTITDPLGGVTRYTWTTYTRSDGKVLPLLASITHPRGFVTLQLQYDTQGRCTRLQAADNGVTTLAYSGAIGADGSTTLTDPRGNTTTWAYTWPAMGGGSKKYGYRLTSVTDPLGRTTTYAAEQAGSNLITKITDFRGRVTTQNWDWNKGNLLSVTKPKASGGTVSSSATYEASCSHCTSITDPLGRTATASVDETTKNISGVTNRRNFYTSFTYATNGDVTSVTDAASNTRYLGYDYHGYPTTVSTSSKTLMSAVWDGAGRRTSVTDGNGKTVQVTWDALDRITAIRRTVNGQTLTTVLEYDANGNRTALIDPKGQRWEWSFNSMDRMVQDKNPLLQTRSYTWDQNGNLSSRTDRKGQRWEFSYGTGDRPTQQTYKRVDGSIEATVSFSYNPNTHLLESVTDSQYGTTSWTYDSLDRVLSEAGPNGTLVTTWDDFGRRSTLQVPGQGLVSYTYDANNNVASVTQNGQTTSYTRDQLDRVTKTTLPNGVTTEKSFNSVGFLSTLVSKRNGVVFDSHTYWTDWEGNITQETANGVVSTFSYDDLYRLTGSNVGGVASSWTYDNVGNRLTQTAGGVTTNYSYNSANRLTAVNGVTVTHDANGSLTGFGNDTYTWDVRGRLRTLSRPGNTFQFGYRQDGIRTSKTVNGAVTTYLLNGDSVVSETTGGVTKHTLQGPGVDNVLQRDGKWFVPNHLGSTMALTNGSGNVVQNYGYKPFGELTNSPTDSNPFQFTGRENDGTGLMYYRSRYYAPQWGRFISEDSLGFTGDINQYAYARNNPVNHRDSSGNVAETLWDAYSLADSILAWNDDPSLLNGIAVALDGFAIVFPGVPAVGKGVRAIGKAASLADNVPAGALGHVPTHSPGALPTPPPAGPGKVRVYRAPYGDRADALGTNGGVMVSHGEPDLYVTTDIDLSRIYNRGDPGYPDSGYNRGVWYNDVPEDEFNAAAKLFGFTRGDGYYQINLRYINYIQQTYPSFFSGWRLYEN